MSQLTQFFDRNTLVFTLTGDVGGAVPPDGSGTINVVGGTGINVTGNPGTNTLTIDSTSTSVDQIQVLYVGKHGNDANDGKNVDKAFLTFGAAMAAASSGDVIWCFDDGTYTENITGVAGISIHAPNAILVGAHTITTDQFYSFKAMVVATGTTGLTMNTGGQVAYARISGFTIQGTGIGCLATAGRLFLDVGRATVENGFFIGSTTADQVFLFFGEIYISGTGTAFGATTGGELHIIGGVVTDNGVGTGTAFFTTGGGTPEIDAGITHIDVDVLSNITAGSDVRLVTTKIEGTASESGAGLIMVAGAQRIDGVPIGAVTPNTGAFTTLTVSTPIGVPSGGTGVGTLTDGGILLGSGTSPVTVTAQPTDGQLLIGSTGLDPVLATLTAGTGVSIANGAGSITISAGGVDQDNIIYFGKHGSDANDGFTIEKAKLTIGAAITAASALTPGISNRIAIVGFDDGIYSETISLPQYVDLNAPNITITGTITAADDTCIEIGFLNVATGTTGLLKSAGTAYCNAIIKTITCSGNGIGVLSLSGFINLTFKQIYVENGVGVGDTSSAQAHMHVNGGDIYITGAGLAIGRANSGTTVGRIDHILDIGVGSGTAITVLAGTIDLNVSLIDNNAAYISNGATSVLNLICNELIGTRTLALGGTANVIGSDGIDDVPIGAITPSTGDFTTITTTGTATIGTGLTITANDLDITSGKVNLPTTTSTDGQITFNGNPFLHAYGTFNTFAGENSGNFTLTGEDNVGFGGNTLTALTSGEENVAIGYNTMDAITSGSYNSAIGLAALSAATTASRNIAFGRFALLSLTTGGRNLALGYSAGQNYTGSESNNCLIYNLGTASDANTIRIGTQGSGDGQQDTTFIAGIYNVTVGGTNASVLVDSAGQLGTVSSSLRYKDNVVDMGESSSSLMNLRPVTFTWKKKPENGMQYGVVAEEVAQVMPNLVNYDDEGRPDSVRYHDMPVILLNELQKLHKRVVDLEKEVADLKGGTNV